MSDTLLKLAIQTALKALGQPNFPERALALFDALGYNTSRQSPFPQQTYAYFKETFIGWDAKFNETKALTAEWRSVDLLFQLSKAEVAGQQGLFDTHRVDNVIIESYLFFAVELAQADYTRTALAQITREINKLFPMPVMIVFKHGAHVTISVIDRRLNKKDSAKDVLEKVTFIKDISVESPHRAHIEILFDLSFAELRRVHKFTNFVELHTAWQKTLDTKELNKRFYRELSNWYFWAVENVSFPNDVANDKDNQVFNSENVIRLLTRLIFIWFIKEKNLIPERIFDEREVKKLLKGFREKGSTVYYRAVLQNLFFATLNQKIEARAFATDGSFEENKINYGIKNLYRYAADFTVSPAEVIRLFAGVPFLNGGLFDCLDSEDKTGRVIYLDGFSRNPKKQARIPDALFFAKEQSIDLSAVYDDKKRQNEKVKGLFEIFNHYKFTVVENTPIEEEVALDPELLGRVFENLLASYNPETQTTARKQTGSFYTPREIVNYMVDESLKAYLKQKLEAEAGMKPADAEVGLEFLLGYNEKEHLFDPNQTTVLINAIDSVKILDPACGSGAFPMGILHKLVHILHKLDPQNKRWKERQLEKAMALDDAAIRDNLIDDIETAFANNELDYGRKLYLIENCIYGVDIQPIATQISKLRFFISLIVDQKADKTRDNFGIRPLPNLETKFVAANTLIGIEKPQVQMSLFDSGEVKTLEAQLKDVRHRLFSAKTPAAKRKLRADDQTLREKMSVLLVANGWGNHSARRLAAWDPYDQHTSADFFDPEWMFGLSEGFDVVIGNPPYIRASQIKESKSELKRIYQCYSGSTDIYVYFYEVALRILKTEGVLTYISSNSFLTAEFGQKLRQHLQLKTRIRQLIDFAEAGVFEAATEPCIVVLQNISDNNGNFWCLPWNETDPLDQIATIFTNNAFSLPQKHLVTEGWRLEPLGTLNLLAKLQKVGVPLGEYIKERFYYGIKTSLNEAFVVDRATRERLIAEHPSSAEIIKPFVSGRDVNRWTVSFTEYLIVIESSENKMHPWSSLPEKKAEEVFAKTYPAIYKFLIQYRTKLLARQDQGRYFWELRSCSYWDAFLEPKIVYKEINRSDAYAFDGESYITNKTTFFIPGGSYFLLGILNSSVCIFFMHKTAGVPMGGFLITHKQFVSQIPIPAAGAEQQAAIEALVAQILAAKQTNPAADVSALEAEIDRRVYRLYGLTEEEIAVVEGR